MTFTVTGVMSLETSPRCPNISKKTVISRIPLGKSSIRERVPTLQMIIQHHGLFQHSIQKQNHISTRPFVLTKRPLNSPTTFCVPLTSISFHLTRFPTLSPPTTASTRFNRLTEIHLCRFSSRSATTNHTSHSCFPISTCNITTLKSSITQMSFTSRTVCRLWHGHHLMIYVRDKMWRD